ncbi:MAG: helix-turn-helix transcriptional regulator [Microbacteriaceae bacterium]
MDDLNTYADAFVQAVAAELRAERAARKLTFKALVATTGLHETTLVRYFKGERDIPMTMLAKICRGLGVDPSTLLDDAAKRVERSQHRGGADA